MSALSAYQAQEAPSADARHHRRSGSGLIQGHGRRVEESRLHRRLVSAPSVLAPSSGTLVRYDRSVRGAPTNFIRGRGGDEGGLWRCGWR